MNAENNGRNGHGSNGTLQPEPGSRHIDGAPVDHLTERVAAYLTESPTSEFHGQSIRILRHWQGVDNLLWQVQTDHHTATLKLFLDAGQARGRRQFDGHATFAPLQLAPPPLWFDRYPQGLARQVLVYTWMPGVELNPDDRLALESLAHTAARVHRAPTDGVRRFCPHPISLDYFWRIETDTFRRTLAQLEAAGISGLHTVVDALATAATRAVEAGLPWWQSAPPAPVHGDLTPENCLLAQGEAILLDWEMYGLGDPSLDIARFLFHAHARLDPAGESAFLTTYLAQMAAPGLRERIAVYSKLLPVQAVCYLLNGVHASLATSPADNMQALAATLPYLAASLQAALARARTGLEISMADDQLTAAIQVWESTVAASIASA
jgi:Ser/Thr protein kinase RdoA (MazF antagonist)